jgi:hypothetical protein
MFRSSGLIVKPSHLPNPPSLSEKKANKSCLILALAMLPSPPYVT